MKFLIKNEKIINRIIRQIACHKRFLITTHVYPDGDAIGSQIALYLLLKRMGKDVELINSFPLPARYKFLPNSGLIKHNVTLPYSELAFVLDVGSKGRLGNMRDHINNIKTVINIDHHLSNDCFGIINWIDPHMSSVGEQIFHLYKYMKLEIRKPEAICLYTAIVTDTGSFQYSNTSAETHLAVSELLQTGIDHTKICNQIYQNIPVSKLKLLQLALETLSFDAKGKIGYMFITSDMYTKACAREEDSEEIVEYARNVEGVEVGILFKQHSQGNIKISFRSKSKINVSKIASKFGGGGHHNAAACTINGELSSVLKNVVRTAVLELRV
ncbi:MAG: bifunctional oligoribonuclease/PAP phosphatase NrnA [bacterium]|nr:bifunctional oligoribonuclease/PAP phosphatase NrnA [bacterium]